MRSSHLLLLLITTQCCFIYHTCVDASTEETVGDESRINGRNASIPTPEELDKLRGQTLENKVKELEKEKNATTNEKNRIESVLNKLMSDWKTANQTYIDAEKKWRDANEELIEKQKPYENLTEDKDHKEKELKEAKFSLQKFDVTARIPIESEQIQEWAKSELERLNVDAKIENLESSDIPSWKIKVEKAENATKPLKEAYDSEALLWDDLGCSKRRRRRQFADDFERHRRSSRQVECAEPRAKMEAARLKWREAESTFNTAKVSLDNAQKELDHLQAVKNLHRLAVAFDDARKKLKNAKQGDVNTILLVRKLREDKEHVKALLPGFAKNVTLLKGQLKIAGKTLAIVEEWYDAYQAANIKKIEEIEEGYRMKSSFPPVEYIVGGVVVALIILVIIIAGVVLARNKCSKKSHPASDNDTTARTIKGAETMRLDSNDFEYATIVICDVYDGDLPHKKAKESVKKLPTSYKLTKNRMRFYFYGLKEDKPIVTGKKVPRMEEFNFQPEMFSSIDVEKIASYLKKFDELEMFSPPLEFGAKIAALGRRPSGLYSKVPTIKPATMRSEFLRYLHGMASRSYDDYSEDGFPFDFKHIIWILANVKQVLKESYTSALCKHDGSIVIVGNLHGQFPDLLRMFGQRATKDSPGWLNHNYLFMGNYIETGLYSLETMIFLFLLKILYPKHIILLRGFSEQICTWVGSLFTGLSKELIDGFGDTKGDILKKAFAEVLGYLPISAVLNGNIFCSNFGIGRTLIDEGSKDKPLDYHYNKIPYPMNELNKNHAEELKKQPKGETLFYDSLGGEPFDQKRPNDLFKLEEGNLRKFMWLYDIKLVFTAEVTEKDYSSIDPNGIHFPFDETYMKVISTPNFMSGYRGATVDINLSGRIGVSICARYQDITNKVVAFKKFKEYNAAGLSMEGPVAPGNDCQRRRMENDDDKKEVMSRKA